MSAALRMRYDQHVDPLYVTVREGEVAETVEGEEAVYADVDDDGRPLGIEFLSGADLLPFQVRRGGEFAVPDRLDTEADIDELCGAPSPTRSTETSTSLASGTGAPE